MAAKPAPGAEYFTAPRHPNQRRYEALRAYFTEGLTVAEAGARAGYTRSSMASLLRDFRAGRLELFAPPGKPGPKTAPAKDRARARVLELRREGLSVHEISARLRAEGTPLNRTGVGQILAEEGFARLLRGPAPDASTSPATPGRDTRLPRAAVIDFAAFPARTETRLAGLLLALPDLVSLDLPGLITAAGYPGTSVIPAASWLLSLLALKLTGTRRVSHVDDLLDRPGQRPVRRAGHPAEEIRAHRLLLPARPRPPAEVPGRPGQEDDQRRAGHRRARRSSTWTSTPSCTGARTRCWKSTTSPAGPSAPARC